MKPGNPIGHLLLEAEPLGVNLLSEVHLEVDLFCATLHLQDIDYVVTVRRRLARQMQSEFLLKLDAAVTFLSSQNMLHFQIAITSDYFNYTDIST